MPRPYAEIIDMIAQACGPEAPREPAELARVLRTRAIAHPDLRACGLLLGASEMIGSAEDVGLYPGAAETMRTAFAEEALDAVSAYTAEFPAGP